MAQTQKPEKVRHQVISPVENNRYYAVLRSTAVGGCTHALVQRLLEAVQQVIVVKWEDFLNGVLAEHVVLVDVNQRPQLPPANHTLRREGDG